MARGSAIMHSTMVANPYPPPKQQVPRVTLCELCDRNILTKDFQGHKVSKKHRAAEENERQEAEKAKKTTGYGDNSDFDNEFVPGESGSIDDLDAAAETGNDGWGSGGDFVTNKTWYKNSGGGGGDRTCHGCGLPGHQKRDCPQGSGGQACFNCGELGHRKIDCTAPRKPMGGGGGSDRVCFNCNQPGYVLSEVFSLASANLSSHNKSDCPEPPTGGGGGGRACHNCGDMGHISRDCDKPRVMKCRNCDKEGHQARECDLPRDWSRVKCRNCNNFRHGEKRCPEPLAENTGGDWGNTGGSGATTSGWGNTAVESTGDWGNAAAVPTADWADDATAAAEDNTTPAW